MTNPVIQEFREKFPKLVGFKIVSNRTKVIETTTNVEQFILNKLEEQKQGFGQMVEELRKFPYPQASYDINNRDWNAALDAVLKKLLEETNESG